MPRPAGTQRGRGTSREITAAGSADITPTAGYQPIVEAWCQTPSLEQHRNAGALNPDEIRQRSRTCLEPRDLKLRGRPARSSGVRPTGWLFSADGWRWCRAGPGGRRGWSGRDLSCGRHKAGAARLVHRAVRTVGTCIGGRLWSVQVDGLDHPIELGGMRYLRAISDLYPLSTVWTPKPSV